jgi:hypothetical protein
LPSTTNFFLQEAVIFSPLLIKMYFNLSWVLAGLTLGSTTFASPILMDKRSTVEEDGVKYTVFEHAATNSVVKFVTNSGICETTPGVNQYSGYFSVGGGTQLVLEFNYRPQADMLRCKLLVLVL